MSSAEIVIEPPGGHSWRARVDRPGVVIGRGRASDIRLDDPDLAPSHVRIVREMPAGTLHVVDLGSPGGTFVNGDAIVHYGPLAERDEIRIGRHRIRLGAGRAAGPAVVAEPPITSAGGMPGTPGSPTPQSVVDESTLQAVRAVHVQLLRALDVRRSDVAGMPDAELRALVRRMTDDILAASAPPPGLDRPALAELVLAEAVGLGALEPLLADETVTEIMVNGPDQVFVERAGRISRAPVAFSSTPALMGVIERIIVAAGRRIDESSPMVDARLGDGSRVNIVIPPLSLCGPAVTIRRFGRRRPGLDDLLASGTLDAAMLEFLSVCVAQRRNVVISGGTGSGKTTLLNILSNLIPAAERIVTIEDAAELQLRHGNLVALEARPANAEGRGHVSIRDLVRNSLRMRPDRIIVGECRGGEALDMLQAMNTGHDGSLTTAHANGPRDLLSRLEVMVLMAGIDLPTLAVREQIASAVHVIVHQARFPCGTRRITHVVEVTGIEGSTIQTQDVFRFHRTGLDAQGRVLGHFASAGHVPAFYEDLQAAGIAVDVGIFRRREAAQ